jgi:hypothetical protein
MEETESIADQSFQLLGNTQDNSRHKKSKQDIMF